MAVRAARLVLLTTLMHVYCMQLVNEGYPACARGLLPHAAMPAILLVFGFYCKRKEKKRKDYAFRRQFNEKPSIILGCPGSIAKHPLTASLQLLSCCQQYAAANIHVFDAG